MARPFAAAGDAVTVTVRLTPKASADRIQGVVDEADGSAVVKVQVTAVPEAGKANAALLKLLAKTWKLPKTSLSVVSGATSRRKVVRIAGEPSDLINRLQTWVRTVS